MYVLTVLYGHPTDPAAFDAHYASTRVPLVEKIPGLESFARRHCASLDGSPPPYYLIAELGYASQEVFAAAAQSPERQAAGADVPNFATGGVTMFIAHD